MGGFTPNLLAGLVGGVAEAQNLHHHEELKNQVEQKDSILKYLSGMASSQEVPAEHRQWAAQKATEYLNWQPGQKLPKLELTGPKGLPAVTYQAPTIHGPSGIAPITLNGQGSLAPNPDPTGPVPLGGNKPGDSIQLPAPPPMTIPGSTSTVSMPTPPPQVISPAGQPYRLTDADVVNRKVDLLQSQVPTLTREAAAAHVLGTEPKDADFINVAPGAALVNKKTGAEVYQNTDRKPGGKADYEPKIVENVLMGVTDNKNGKLLTDPKTMPPDAKAVWDATRNAETEKENRQEAKEKRVQAAAIDRQARAATIATDKQVQSQAVDASKKALPMVNILDTAEKYVKSGQFTPRQDIALVIQGVRAMNPGTVRIPNKEIELELKAGSYGDRFSRAYEVASKGTLPNDQRNDLMNVIRNETTTAAKSAAANWQQSFKGKQALPPHLKRFGNVVNTPDAPPSGAGELPPGWKE